MFAAAHSGCAVFSLNLPERYASGVVVPITVNKGGSPPRKL